MRLERDRRLVAALGADSFLRACEPRRIPCDHQLNLPMSFDPQLCTAPHGQSLSISGAANAKLASWRRKRLRGRVNVVLVFIDHHAVAASSAGCDQRPERGEDVDTSDRDQGVDQLAIAGAEPTPRPSPPSMHSTVTPSRMSIPWERRSAS